MCTPGWERRAATSLIVMAVIAISVGFAWRSGEEEWAAALGIFAISVLGFSLVAAISYDAAMCWRLVDCLWICSSFAAVVVALVTIEEAVNRERTSSARSEITDSFAGLLFAAQSIVTNDCEQASSDDVRPRSPEPYKGACDRVKHLLPQMTYQYNEFSRSRQASSLKISFSECRGERRRRRQLGGSQRERHPVHSDGRSTWARPRKPRQQRSSPQVHGDQESEILVFPHGVLCRTSPVKNDRRHVSAPSVSIFNNITFPLECCCRGRYF